MYWNARFLFCLILVSCRPTCRPSWFEELCTKAGLKWRPVKEIQEFNATKHYNASGIGTDPVVLRGAAKSMKAIARWHEPGYLLSIFNEFDPQMRAVVTTKTFFRGTDAFDGTDSGVRVEEGPEFLFTDKANKASRAKAYMGLIDISDVNVLKDDVGGLPSFMLKGPDNKIPFADHHDRALALWVGTGDVDSGLHGDWNHGGFIALVTGVKNVLLFPPSDAKLLYLRNPTESKIFVVQELQRAAGLEKYPLLYESHPMVTKLEVGDVLHIPHAWFHEIYSEGESLALSTWVHNPDDP